MIAHTIIDCQTCKLNSTYLNLSTKLHRFLFASIWHLTDSPLPIFQNNLLLLTTSTSTTTTSTLNSTPTGRIPVPVFQADLWKSVSYSSTNLTWNMNKKVKVYYDSLNHEVVIRYNAIDSRLNKCNHIKEVQVLNMFCLIFANRFYLFLAKFKCTVLYR